MNGVINSNSVSAVSYHTGSERAENLSRGAEKMSNKNGASIRTSGGRMQTEYACNLMENECASVYRSVRYNDQLHARSRIKRKNPRVGHQTARQMDQQLVQSVGQDSGDNESAGQGMKLGFMLERKRMALHVHELGFVAHAARMTKLMTKDVMDGMSAKELRKEQVRFLGREAGREARTAFRSVKSTAAEIVTDTHLGQGGGFSSEMPDKLKDAAINGAKGAWYGMRGATRTVHSTYMIVRHPKRIFWGIRKAIAGVISALPAIGLMLLLAAASSLLVLAVLIFNPATNLTAEDKELSDIWLYITQADCRFESRIRNDLNVGQPDEIIIKFNGTEVASIKDLHIQTDAEKVMGYLNAKFESYDFAAVKPELDKLMSALYTYTIRKSLVRNSPGQTSSYLTGEKVKQKSVWEIDITAASLDGYIADNLSEEQKATFSELQEFGIFTLHQEAESPFPGVDWHQNISSRFGWRYHPITDELKIHRGLDIAMPEGTPVSCVMTGHVTTVAYDDSYGNYVDVTNSASGDITRYAHLQVCSVTVGQIVDAGEQIGCVGNTGASTGPHLHIEFLKGGKNLNPLFYLQCDE